MGRLLSVGLAGVLAAGSLFLGAPAAAQVKKFELVATRKNLVVDEGVVWRAFTWNGRVPGPLLVVEEGDEVEIAVRNADTITHGLSIHAANTQTSAVVGNIPAGQSRTLRFRADFPGVYMYHCAPGGHGILAHTMGGMFGMVVVEPKRTKYRLEEELGRPPDVRVYMVQHEVYGSGKDFADGRALYVTFNGYNFRYVTQPIQARPGDYVRFYYLNVGPNLVGSFHAVGGIWEYAYAGGNPQNVTRGLQTTIAAPTDSWVIEWRVPAEGSFLLVTHAFGVQAMKGAVGVLSAKKDGPRTAVVRPEGPNLPLPAKPKRVVDPFGLGSSDVDVPVRLRPGDPAFVRMVGNSYWPKVLEVPVGSRVTWVNEDVFDLLEGERTGMHNVTAVRGPTQLASPLLKHADRFTLEVRRPGEYEYICAIHPYMRAKLRVYRPGAEELARR
jgi:nitrite reductase (NO-forming)